jgi:hypothetical protein
MLKYILIFLIAGFSFYSCSKIDPVTGEKVLTEVNPEKKARDFADKGGGIFGEINKKSSGTNFEFATSNVLWRATLQSLDFLPLINADYAGGVIIYDWYSKDPESTEQIKISVRFLNNELRSDSIKIIAHKKICDSEGKCKTSIINNNFSNEIKDGIITSARSLKISDQKKDNK